jgi:FkbM family methyltransferase
MNLYKTSKYQLDKRILGTLLKKDDPIIFDIGAHWAEDSEEFATNFPKAKIYLFEPDIRCLRKIRKLKSKFIVFEGVISDTNGFESFFPSNGNGKFKEWDGSGSIMIPNLHTNIFPEIKFDEPYFVSSVTLDTYVEQNNIDFIDFIWADIQGAELRMIKGGEKTFMNKVRYLYTEYCEMELYTGAPNRETILRMLPSFTLLQLCDFSDITGNMLLENNRLKENNVVHS